MRKLDKSFADARSSIVNDVDQSGAELGEFPTGTLYRSKSAGEKLKAAGASDNVVDPGLFPASEPFLRTNVSITLQRNASRHMARLLAAKAEAGVSGPAAWAADVSAIEEELNSAWTDLPISWDLRTVGGQSATQTIVLKPRTMYTFEAHIEIYPTYIGDFNDKPTRFRSWTTRVVSQQVALKRLGHADRNKCIVRHRVSFEARSHAVLEKMEYSFNDFIVEMGAASALLGIGLTLLTVFQNTIVPKYTQFTEKKAQKAEAQDGGASTTTRGGGQSMLTSIRL